MFSLTINLLQKNDSPQLKVLSQVLGQLDAKPYMRFIKPPFPQNALAAPSIWVWDTHGFTPEQVEDAGRDLQPDHLGVMVICSGNGEMDNRAVQRSGAIQLVVCPAKPEIFISSLHETNHIQKQINDLLAQRDTVRQKIADRMIVEQAKRLVMVEMKKTEPEAMRHLQCLSRRSKQKLVITAHNILDANEDPKPKREILFL